MRPGVLVMSAALVLAACAGSSANDGDCVARIRFHGVVYAPNNGLRADAPAGTSLGPADVVGCDGGAPRIDSVRITEVRGVNTRIAIRTGVGSYRGIYVAETVPHRSWPPAIRPGPT